MAENFSGDGIELLQQTSSGCKMALDTIDHIKSHVKDRQLIEIMDKYHKKHEELQEECYKLLGKAGKESKEPNKIAQVFATLQSRVKMFVDDDKSTAAGLLTDGCNMGIKTISEYINEYKNADEQIKKLADKLRDVEKQMIGDIQPLL